MIIHQSMTESDNVQRFMFEHASIRGEIVHLNETYTKIIHQKSYPAIIQTLLGEAILGCILLASSIKFKGSISLQFNGDERLPLLLVQCDDDLQIRAFAKHQPDGTPPSIDYHEAFIHGQMKLIINQYHQTTQYESTVSIKSISMADNLMHYFAQSEQIATRVWFAINQHQAAGMLLQLMPGQNTLQREQFWEYAVHIGQTISDHELLTLDNETILNRLYHETELRLYNKRKVQFKCQCTQEKMQQILRVLGPEENQKLLDERGSIDVYCDFCNQHYNFDAIDVALLFR